MNLINSPLVQHFACNLGLVPTARTVEGFEHGVGFLRHLPAEVFKFLAHGYLLKMSGRNLASVTRGSLVTRTTARHFKTETPRDCQLVITCGVVRSRRARFAGPFAFVIATRNALFMAASLHMLCICAPIFLCNFETTPRDTLATL